MTLTEEQKRKLLGIYQGRLAKGRSKGRGRGTGSGGGRRESAPSFVQPTFTQFSGGDPSSLDATGQPLLFTPNSVQDWYSNESDSGTGKVLIQFDMNWQLNISEPLLDIYMTQTQAFVPAGTWTNQAMWISSNMYDDNQSSWYTDLIAANSNADVQFSRLTGAPFDGRGSVLFDFDTKTATLFDVDGNQINQVTNATAVFNQPLYLQLRASNSSSSMNPQPMSIWLDQLPFTIPAAAVGFRKFGQ